MFATEAVHVGDWWRLVLVERRAVPDVGQHEDARQHCQKPPGQKACGVGGRGNSVEKPLALSVVAPCQLVIFCVLQKY